MKRHPPSIWIQLTVEERTPRLRMGEMTEAEHDRLIHWINSQPALAELFLHAVELEDAAKAARRRERDE
jgi:hypothetical protein